MPRPDAVDGGKRWGHGFSPEATSEPWLPVPDGWGQLSVEAQSGDEASMLVLCRCALGIRAQLHRNGEVSADDVVVWERTGDGRLVAAREGGISLVLAMGDEAVLLPDGDVLIASAPLTSGGWLPADGAAWLRRPEAE